MMSEKRFGNIFVLVDGNIEIMLKDTEEEFLYEAVSPLVERLLNYFDVEIKKLKEENEQLKRQLLYDGDDVCDICKHEYLIPKGDYFIKKCEKGHEECLKKNIKYCEDFELIQIDFEDLIKRMDKELKND